MENLFTKSSFISGLRCSKKMFLELNHTSQTEALSLAQNRIIQQGINVQEYARQKFTQGILITGNSLEALEKTKEAIKNNVNCLFEAAFVFNKLLVRCDILKKTEDGIWDLIEIKSSTKVKPEHINDVAIQKYVLVNCLLPINTVNIMHINNQDCFFPNLDNIFIIQNISDVVNQKLLELDIDAKINKFKQIINNPIQPTVSIGRHCNKPDTCSFKSYCWKDVPEPSIFTIPRLSEKIINQLLEKQILAIRDIDKDIKLTNIQKQYVDLVTTNKHKINLQDIQTSLSKLEYPLHFFDIETYNPAIPRFDGLKPYEQFIFQYSCHILQKDGSLEHYEYLYTENLDPRRFVIQALINHIQPTGKIVVYHKSFESSIIKKLAQDFPEYQESLSSILERLWDQEEIFKTHYKHPNFYGSTSLKKVLPVLVSSLSYDSLEVQKGDDAQAIWNEMIMTSDENSKAQMIENLKSYCKLDTLAMVKIHQRLLELD
ncbi:MAG: DUF2779 domain-containing protein [Crocosphaera sp.]|jgi:hypothetical protein